LKAANWASSLRVRGIDGTNFVSDSRRRISCCVTGSPDAEHVDATAFTELLSTLSTNHVDGTFPVIDDVTPSKILEKTRTCCLDSGCLRLSATVWGGLAKIMLRGALE